MPGGYAIYLTGYTIRVILFVYIFFSFQKEKVSLLLGSPKSIQMPLHISYFPSHHCNVGHKHFSTSKISRKLSKFFFAQVTLADLRSVSVIHHFFTSRTMYTRYFRHLENEQMTVTYSVLELSLSAIQVYFLRSEGSSVCHTSLIMAHVLHKLSHFLLAEEKPEALSWMSPKQCQCTWPWQHCLVAHCQSHFQNLDPECRCLACRYLLLRLGISQS